MAFPPSIDWESFPVPVHSNRRALLTSLKIPSSSLILFSEISSDSLYMVN